jgi:hypothetical protein
VLATLWPVADASTAALMRALYQAHKGDHLDKADARGLARASTDRATGTFPNQYCGALRAPLFLGAIHSDGQLAIKKQQNLTIARIRAASR